MLVGCSAAQLDPANDFQGSSLFACGPLGGGTDLQESPSAVSHSFPEYLLFPEAGNTPSDSAAAAAVTKPSAAWSGMAKDADMLLPLAEARSCADGCSYHGDMRVPDTVMPIPAAAGGRRAPYQVAATAACGAQAVDIDMDPAIIAADVKDLLWSPAIYTAFKSGSTKA